MATLGRWIGQGIVSSVIAFIIAGAAIMLADSGILGGTFGGAALGLGLLGGPFIFLATFAVLEVRHYRAARARASHDTHAHTLG